MRSRNIMATIILQNISQLKALFKDDWEGIIGNADTLTYLGGNEKESHKYISELLGKETIDTTTSSRSRGRNGSYSQNFQQTGRELLTPDEVRICLLYTSSAHGRNGKALGAASRTAKPERAFRSSPAAHSARAMCWPRPMISPRPTGGRSKRPYWKTTARRWKKPFRPYSTTASRRSSLMKKMCIRDRPTTSEVKRKVFDALDLQKRAQEREKSKQALKDSLKSPTR